VAACRALHVSRTLFEQSMLPENDLMIETCGSVLSVLM